MSLYRCVYDSPVGELTLVAETQALQAILWENEQPNRIRLAQSVACSSHPIFEDVIGQLNQYFAGERTDFTSSFKLQGTAFQLQVWRALQQINYGHTCSYLDIAEYLGKPKAVRAVANAIGKNPLSIIIPCHRVIGKNGSLTGFAGGLANKRFLLDLERSHSK